MACSNKGAILVDVKDYSMLLEVDKTENPGKISFTPGSLDFAEVAELADALRSGRSGHYAREGSNPSFGTGTSPASIAQGFCFPCEKCLPGVR